MISTVITIKKGMKEKKWTKKKIGVGSAVKSKVGEIEESTREGRNRRTRKELVVCFQYMLGKKRKKSSAHFLFAAAMAKHPPTTSTP